MCDLQPKLTTWLLGFIHKVGILLGKSYFKTIGKYVAFRPYYYCPLKYMIYSARIKH